jgi:hypothetical protein
MVLENVEDPSFDGLMGLKKISTTSVLETGKISPLTVPDGGVVLSRPRPTLGCSAHDDDEDIGIPHGCQCILFPLHILIIIAAIVIRT